MRKKMMGITIIIITMLVTISLATATSSEEKEQTKESPLYKIRAKSHIGQKIGNIVTKIKTKFLGERMFFMPNKPITNQYRMSLREMAQMKSPTHGIYERTCYFPVDYCWPIPE